jgi:excisionase family DNA binding protein
MPVNAALLNAAEAADLLGCSEGFIRKRIKSGELPAHKERRRWQIRREDLNRLIGQPGDLDHDRTTVADDGAAVATAPTERMTALDGRTAVSGDSVTVLTERPAVSGDHTTVLDEGVDAPDSSVTVATAPTERMTVSGDRTAVLEDASHTSGPDIDDWDARALRLKLAASERENDLLSQDMGRLRGDYERVQDQLDSALSSVGSLTEEIKGLTVALHREQERHALAAAPVEEPFREPKPSLMKRLFARNKRPRHVRIGHA